MEIIMKNHRDVCLATHAGYAEYQGLPGMVQTGCPNTPDYKSRFCSLHKPTIPVQTGEPSSTVDKLIIGSRSTRQGKTYEVITLVEHISGDARSRFTEPM